MFKAVIQDTSILRDSLDAISGIVTEGSFEISKEGITLHAMDPASVAMISFKILPTAFLEYDCKENSTITINIPNFVNVIKRSKANDQLTISLGENKLKMVMQGDTRRTFALPLLENPGNKQKVPELSFKGKIELSASSFNDGIKDASMVSDCIVLEANSGTFTIKSFGDISETKMELAKDSPSLISLDVISDIKSKYSIDYLERMMKGAKIADTVTVRFGTDYPMKLDCTALDKLQLSFILAPRVDTD
jgi:proliferating cell nuclear antigen